MTSLRRAFTILCLLLSFLAQNSSVKAVDTFIYNSISAQTDFSNITPISASNEKLAQEFTASATLPLITQISMILSRDASATGTFDVSIYSKNTTSGDPDQKVTSVASSYSVSSLSSTPTAVDFTGLSINLGSASNYFVVLENFNGSFAINWSYLPGGSDPEPGLLPDDYDGTNWSQGTSDVAYLMSVSATAVPEPSTYALMSIGVAVLCGIAQRRRLQKPI